MKILDSHQHFWKFDPVRDAWIDASMAVLQRDFLPVDVLPIYENNGVEGSIAVQADTSEAETDFLLALAEEHNFIKGVVGWLDLCSPTLSDRLAVYRPHKKLKGLRHIVQKEPLGYMDRKDFRRGIGLLSALDWSYDLLIFPHQLEEALALVDAFPQQSFILDHCAKPYIKKGILEPWKKQLLALGERPHVSCKISGLVTEADWSSWGKKDFMPYLDAVVEAFGTQRLMFGSDWPVCQVAGGYTAVLDIVKSYFSSFTDTEKTAIFSGNTERLYKI